jgi:capsular polysaccharide biosynthesis protein
MEIKQFMGLIRKRFLLIALCVAAAAVATALYSYFLAKPVYEASTKLIVNKSVDGGLQSLSLESVNVDLHLIDTYKEIIKTPAIMNQVVEKHPDLGVTADDLIRLVKVSSVNNTQVMTVDVRDASPKRAADIANAVSEVFKQQISTIMKVDNVAILNEAKAEEHAVPVAPKPVLNLAISIVVSLLLAVGIAYLLEYMDDTIRTEEDVQRALGLPTVAVIPKIRESQLKRGQSAAATKQRMGDTSYAAANR